MKVNGTRIDFEILDVKLEVVEKPGGQKSCIIMVSILHVVKHFTRI